MLGVVTAALLGALSSSAVATPPPHVSTTLVHADEGASGTVPCSATAAYADGLQVVLAAHAVVPSAAAIRIECGLVQEGTVVASVTAIGAPIAANATTARTFLDPYYVCANTYVMYVDGSEVYDRGCP